MHPWVGRRFAMPERAGAWQGTSLATRAAIFAAYLFYGGFDIRTVRELPCHRDVKTTIVDTHVRNRGPAGVQIPPEGLRSKRGEFHADLHRMPS